MENKNVFSEALCAMENSLCAIKNPSYTEEMSLNENVCKDVLYDLAFEFINAYDAIKGGCEDEL